MTLLERLQADLRDAPTYHRAHPMKLMQVHLPDLWPAGELKNLSNGDRVAIGGAVITRQRPGTARRGSVSLRLTEDETGHANAIVRPDLFEANRLVINLEPALIISGQLQKRRGRHPCHGRRDRGTACYRSASAGKPRLPLTLSNAKNVMNSKEFPVAQPRHRSAHFWRKLKSPGVIIKMRDRQVVFILRITLQRCAFTVISLIPRMIADLLIQLTCSAVQVSG